MGDLFQAIWNAVVWLWQSTGLDQWNVLVILSFGVSVASLVYSWKTVKGVERIDKECQRLLLMDVIRHLYRNKVCTLAMQMKFEKEPTKFPSEEHFLKLQLLPKDLYLDQFYKEPKKFDLLHELEMLFRNYNTEIEVAMKHISTPGIDVETKKRDFGTLRFKPDYLSFEILKLMNRIWKEKGLSETVLASLEKMTEEEKAAKELSTPNALEMAAIIKKKQTANREGNIHEKYWGEIDEELLASDQQTDKFYTPLFRNDPDYSRRLNEDVRIECGCNGKGEEKIHMIFIDRLR